MRGWYALVGLLFGLLCFSSVRWGRMSYPTEVFLLLVGLVLIVGSIVYGFVWAVLRLKR